MPQPTKRKQKTPLQHPLTKKRKTHLQILPQPKIEKERATFFTLPRELRQQIINDTFCDRLIGFEVNRRSTFLRYNGEKWVHHEKGGRNRERAFEWALRLRGVGGVLTIDAEDVYERLMRMAFKAAKEEFDGEVVMHIKRVGGFKIME